MRSLNVRCTKESVLTVQRSRRWKRRMVYLLVANKSYRYKSGRRSHVIYIGGWPTLNAPRRIRVAHPSMQSKGGGFFSSMYSVFLSLPGAPNEPPLLVWRNYLIAFGVSLVDPYTRPLATREGT
jgi:hypothetical protein